jgi:hypothetical protein
MKITIPPGGLISLACLTLALGASPVTFAKDHDPVAVVGRGPAEKIAETVLLPARVGVDSATLGKTLAVENYQNFSAIIFTGPLEAGHRWDLPENTDAVRAWLEEGGVAVIMGILSVPNTTTSDVDRIEFPGLAEFLGFSKLRSYKGEISIHDLEHPIFQKIPEDRRGQPLRWSWQSAGPTSARAADSFSTANILAGDKYGVITVNKVGKGAVYYFGPRLFPVEEVPEDDLKFYCEALIAAVQTPDPE